MIVKVCGMREPENIRAVERLDIDWMGFIFYERSSRFVEQCPAYLPHTKRVGVFVDESIDRILEKRVVFGLQMVQLHGEESPDFCRTLRTEGIEVIKALPIASADDLQEADRYDSVCDYLLFDSKTEQRGGSGYRFDWNLLSQYVGSVPFLLSGGISETDADAIRNIRHPAFSGVDLNSRFEIAPAVKNVTCLDRFIRTLKNNQ